MERMLVPASLLAVAHRQGGLLDIRQCRAFGVTDRVVSRLVSRREWTRVARGVYEVRGIGSGDGRHRPATRRSPDDIRLRSAWIGLLAYGEQAIATGACALALHGVAGLPSYISPEVAVLSPGRGARTGLRVRRYDDSMVIVELSGRRVVSVEWALAQAVPELPRANGLAVLDSALHRAKLDTAGLQASRDLARGRRGVATRHSLWQWADGRAESPLESFARLDCIDAGVPPDALQLTLPVASGERRARSSTAQHDARFLARGDMAWRLPDERWLVVEMDGAEFHSGPDAVYADRYRQNRILASGRVDLLRFTARDIGRVGAAVLAHLRSHGFGATVAIGRRSRHLGSCRGERSPAESAFSHHESGSMVRNL